VHSRNQFPPEQPQHKRSFQARVGCFLGRGYGWLLKAPFCGDAGMFLACHAADGCLLGVQGIALGCYWREVRGLFGAPLAATSGAADDRAGGLSPRAKDRTLERTTTSKMSDAHKTLYRASGRPKVSPGHGNPRKAKARLLGCQSAPLRPTLNETGSARGKGGLREPLRTVSRLRPSDRAGKGVGLANTPQLSFFALFVFAACGRGVSPCAII
jgi:hypothetical protein